MAPIHWIVIATGIAAIAWINWYFFVADRGSARATVDPAGTQEVTVTVKGGYAPATVHVHHGVPVRLTFDRQETASCSEEVVIGDFGIRRSLPAFQKTSVEFMPAMPGTHDFACGMNMLHGKIVVD